MLALAFQFFPSCCGFGLVKEAAVEEALSILSQLLLLTHSYSLFALLPLPKKNFQFFPSCCEVCRLIGEQWRSFLLSILSQLLLERVSALPGAPRQGVR
jgi:hypothetical protein